MKKNYTPHLMLFILLMATYQLAAQAPTITTFSPISGSVGTNVTITGIQNLTSNEGGFTIFPNPASGQFTLSPGALVKGAYVVRIHDITGRQMYTSRNDAYSTPNLFINTSGWASGMYTIIVETPEGAMSRKLMVQGR